MHKVLWAATVLSMCLGCSPQEGDVAEGELGTSGQALQVENGRTLNGRGLNGRTLNGRGLNGRGLNGRGLNGRGLNGRGLNGRGLNGRGLNGRGLNGVSLNGLLLAGVTGEAWLEGSVISAARNDQILTGEQLLGSELIALDGTLLRLDSIDRDEESPSFATYVVSYETAAGRATLCGEDEEGLPYPAVALAGLWNYDVGQPGGGDHVDVPDTFTFACAGYALAKCVAIGYWPWATERACDASGACWDHPLDGHHQACTRMMRADYCGDGRSHTVDGTVINVYDVLGIQLDTEGWTLEAEWNESGATCVDSARRRGGHFPQCARPLKVDDCGNLAHFSADTLLMSEAQQNKDR